MMIKKIVLVIALLFLLAGCVEITDDPTIKKPEIDFNIIGSLEQIYEETEELEDVTFELILKNFTENKIKEEDVTIKWFEGETIKPESENLKTHTVEVKKTMNLEVKVIVSYILDGEEHELTPLTRVVSVIEKPTQVSVTNSLDRTKHILLLKYNPTNRNVTYTASISGNLTHTKATWVIQKRSDSMEVIAEERIEVMLQEEMVIVNNIGTLKLEKEYDTVGNYLVYLEIGKYTSSYQHLTLSYADFEIELLGNDVEASNYQNRTLSIGAVDEQLGSGTYQWYVNGEEIVANRNQFEFVHTNKNVGGYLYAVKFTPDDETKEVQETEPVLIVNGVIVNDETEFYQAIINNEAAIILNSDINLGTNKVTIDYPLTIVGKGKTIVSDGIDIIIEVKANNVYFKDLSISSSKKYNIHYNRVKNGYLENVTFIEPGTGGSMTDLSAGLYVNSSEVTIKNITIVNGSNTGIRIDSPQHDVISRLTVLGEFDHGGVFLPIASGNSKKENVEVVAKGFVVFSLPLQSSSGEAGEDSFAIRRWSNDSDAVKWQLIDPNKTEYAVSETLDLYGIQISVQLGAENIIGGLDLVYIFLDMFNQYGTIEIVKNDEVVSTYYIVGHENKTDNPNYQSGLDKLIFAADKDGNTLVRPVLPNEIGDYEIRVSIGGELNLGSFDITIK